MSEVTDSMFEVEKIIGQKMVNDKMFYRVKWKDYPVNQSTWEIATHLGYVQDLIDEYVRSKDVKTEPTKNQDKQRQGRSQICLEKQLDIVGINSMESQLRRRNFQSDPPHQKEKAISKKGEKMPSNTFLKIGRKKKQSEDLNLTQNTTLSQVTRRPKTNRTKKTANRENSFVSRFIVEDALESSANGEEQKLFKTFHQGMTPGSSAGKSKTSVISRIRLLESAKPSCEIQEYLVEFLRGEMKIFTTIEMTIAYPFEFVDYLEKKANRS